MPSALQEGLTSTATRLVRGCAFSGRCGVHIPHPAGNQPRWPISECKPEPPASSSSVRDYWLLGRKCEEFACVVHESNAVFPRGYSCGGTCLKSACVFVAMQDAPGLRIRPRKSRDLMEVGRMARMRRFRAKLITYTSLLCAQRTGLEPIVFRRQVSARVVAHDCSTEPPLPADVRTAQPSKLYVRSSTHAGCMCAASSCWITTAPAHMDFACRCDRAVRLVPFGTSTVARRIPANGGDAANSFGQRSAVTTRGSCHMKLCEYTRSAYERVLRGAAIIEFLRR